MAKKSRIPLKNAFADGAQPTAEAFGDLIDSALNVLEDGFDKSDADGFKVTQLGKDGRLISFYENTPAQSAWSMRIEPGGKQFHIEDDAKKPVLVLASSGASDKEAGRVGVNKTDPSCALDVDGVVAAKGRFGSLGGLVKANGEWQDVTADLDGCQAFEVMAGVGDKTSGRYALMHAFALNTFNRHGHISRHQSHYSSRCDQLDLRWHGSTHRYRLQIRTRCAYGPKVAIRYSLTELWFDYLMSDCVLPDDDKVSGSAA